MQMLWLMIDPSASMLLDQQCRTSAMSLSVNVTYLKARYYFQRYCCESAMFQLHKMYHRKHFEPKLALLADNDGLELILLLIAQIHDKKLVVDNGYLILESEPRQHARIKRFAKAHKFRLRQTVGFIQLYQINY
jgi:hypothetical protein